MDKFVKPVGEAFVRDPRTKAVMPKEGMTVPWTGPIGRFYRRRLRDGSIEIVEPVKTSTSRYSRSKTTEEVTTDDN